LEYVSDINTGAACFKSYKKYIKIVSGKQVLVLRVIFYIDGAATAQFSDLPITAVKFTFGIFNQRARSRRCGEHLVTSLPFGRREVERYLMLQNVTKWKEALPTG
jgi:hypothetical protein